MTQTYAAITGTGLYAPEKVVTNAYFNDYYGEDVDTFLRENRNIRERRYAADGEATSDLAVAAARTALASAGRDVADVDLIVLATDTPDYVSPSTSVIVQHKLGAVNAGAFDINSACAGFVTALNVGRRFVEGPDGYGCVLVIGAYLMSRYLDYSQRNIATLFADGAGAVVLTRSTDAGVLYGSLSAEGQFAEDMGIYVGGSCNPAQPSSGEAPNQLLEFRRKFPRTFNVDRWTALVSDLSTHTGVLPSEVDHYFFTQINTLSIRETMDALNVPLERAHQIMDRYGYTGSACVPMAIADVASKHLLKAGQTAFLVASGGGASLAALALKWTYDT